MRRISDEMIMAYVDGELDGARAEMVRQALDQDPELTRRAEVFTESAAVLRVFDEVLDEEVPDRLLETARTAPAGSWHARLAARVRRLRLVPNFYPVPALAALIILVLGGWLAHQGLRGPGVNKAPSLVAGQGIARVLETVPSGQRVSLGDGTVMEPVLTFQDQHGIFCRRFDLWRDGQMLGGGIGCRTEREVWDISVYRAEARTHGEKVPARQGYELAGVEDDLDAYMEKHRRGPIFSPPDERRLLERGWKAGP